MPIYEYKCDNCGEVRTALRPVSEYKDDLVEPCVNRPLSSLEMLHGVTEENRPNKCTFKRILSPTPTTFRFNDKKGFSGLDTKRGS